MDKLLVITGPTASGKTSLAVQLALRFNGEIICADSRTIYKGMDIGTAKVTQAEMRGIPHYGLDLVEPNERYSVGAFKCYAEEMIANIVQRGKLPILVGGTGLYVSAILENYGFEGENGPLKYDALLLMPAVERGELYGRVNDRVDAMLKNGLMNEVQQLLERYGEQAPGLSAIGYRQVVDNLLGRIDDGEMERLLKRDTRRYAKRQMTWWKHHGEVLLVRDYSESEKMVAEWLET